MDGRSILLAGSNEKQDHPVQDEDEIHYTIDTDNDMIMTRSDYELLQAFHRFVPLPALSSKIVRLVCEEDLQVEDDCTNGKDDNNQSRDTPESTSMHTQKSHPTSHQGPLSPSRSPNTKNSIATVKQSPLARRLSKPHREVNLANLTLRAPAHSTREEL